MKKRLCRPRPGRPGCRGRGRRLRDASHRPRATTTRLGRGEVRDERRDRGTTAGRELIAEHTRLMQRGIPATADIRVLGEGRSSARPRWNRCPKAPALSSALRKGARAGSDGAVCEGIRQAHSACLSAGGVAGYAGSIPDPGPDRQRNPERGRRVHDEPPGCSPEVFRLRWQQPVSSDHQSRRGRESDRPPQQAVCRPRARLRPVRVNRERGTTGQVDERRRRESNPLLRFCRPPPGRQAPAPS